VHILLVDDDRSVLTTAGRYLASRGHGVRTASSGLGALQAMGEAEPDLVISDIQMPGMDGVALLRAVRAEYPGVAFVLTTGHATVDTAVAALRLGAADYLSKPIKLEELQACIDRVQGAG